MRLPEDEFARAPQWLRPDAQFGIQRYGLRGDLWRVVEKVTKSGLYINHGDAYGSSGAAALVRDETGGRPVTTKGDGPRRGGSRLVPERRQGSLRRQ